MKQILLKKGMVHSVEIPEPATKAGYVKIKVFHSCISAGTEITGISESRKSLLRKVIDKPQKIITAAGYLKNQGVKSTKDKLSSISDKYLESGYSISGQVVEIGKEVNNLSEGDLIAAGGMGFAIHAEYVLVPKNLVVKLPKNLDTLYASTATVGAISLHGIRRADLKIGEYGVVFGAGLLGLIAVQILKSSGVRVACIDINPERINLAKSIGAELVINSSIEDPVSSIRNWSCGYGADAVLFTANTSDSNPLSQAFKMTRKKGKVVLVGVSGMYINRKDIYSNEIDFLISTSYGPGRYDDDYELKGIDYPYSYVRWTENRNIAEFLRLLKEGAVDLDLIKPTIYDFNDFSKAFEDLQNDPSHKILSILEYNRFEPKTQIFSPVIKSREKRKGVISTGLIGAGSFATTMLLPIIDKLSDKYDIHTIVDMNGKKAFDAAMHFKASKHSSSLEDVLFNDEIELVAIATRHGNHADLVLQCLQAGKNVYVEKPLAVTRVQLEKIKRFYDDDSIKIKPLLTVGFNRRFSRYIIEVKQHIRNRINPLFIHYRMNAGYASTSSWVHEDGGRIIGEACHIFDLLLFLTDSTVKELSVASLNPTNGYYIRTDNKSITMTFEDGSIAVLDYFAVGNKEFPKEYLEIHYDNKSITMDDYKNITGFGVKLENIKTKLPRKGHYEEWLALYDSLNQTPPVWPIEFEQLIQTTELSFLAAEI